MKIDLTDAQVSLIIDGLRALRKMLHMKTNVPTTRKSTIATTKWPMR